MWECVRFSTQAELFPFPSCVTSERAHEVRRVILLLTCKLLQEKSIIVDAIECALIFYGVLVASKDCKIL